MSQPVESHYVNTGFSTESYIYLFEGFPYNYAEMSSPIMMHDQESIFRSLQTASNKFDLASPGTLAHDSGQAHVEDGNVPVPQTVEEPRQWDANLVSDSPVEYIRSNSNASSSQVFWQDNIDPDNMTYEELLDLGEAVGTQSRGLSQDLISTLPVAKYKSGSFFWRKKSRGDPCVICQMDYKRGDRQMTLPCKHVYHAKCASQWLSINKACPICFSEVRGKESE